MILRKLPDGWTVCLDDDGETEKMRFKEPEGVTFEDRVAFAEFILKLARERQHGPN